MMPNASFSPCWPETAGTAIGSRIIVGQACPLREIRKTAVKWPPTEAALLAVPINLESEFGLENGAGFVPDLDCHPVPKDMPTSAPNGIFGHVGQGSRGFFLHRFDIRQFHAFLVRGDNVAVSQVEKVSLHNNIERRETESVPSQFCRAS